jgi:uncharacterized membrane protein (DUF2068 family)
MEFPEKFYAAVSYVNSPDAYLEDDSVIMLYALFQQVGDRGLWRGTQWGGYVGGGA